MDWQKIKAEYIAGGISYRKLAEKYDIPFGTFKRVAINEKWRKLKEQAEKKATTRIVNEAAKKNAKIDDKYFRLVDKLLDKAEEVIENTPAWQSVTLKEMATALKYIKECKGVKSEADMREQEARIKRLLKDAETEQTNNTITVTFGNEDAEKWAK